MKTPDAMVPWTLDRVEQAIRNSPRMVLDCETEGLDWRHHRVCGWVLGFGPTLADTTYLPVRHKGGGNLPDPVKVARCIRDSVKKNPKIRMQGFNLSFDLKFAHGEGIGIDLFHEDFEDGQINAFLIDERQRSFSLDACAEFAGATAKKGDELYKHMAAKFGGEPDRKQMQHFHQLAGDDWYAVDYAMGDSISTWDLIDRQQEELDVQDLRNIWRIECQCIRALTRMELLGVRVNEERLNLVRRLVQAKLTEALRGLPKDFNERAPSQMIKLFTDAGYKDKWPTTGKGNPSFAEEWLLTTELGRRIVSLRKLSNLENSFLGPLLERHLYRGRVHTTFNQTRGEEYGTITGRLSSSQPNMQQVPKRNELLGPMFRSLFIPDDGCLLAGADYSQCEPRLLAHFADVKALILGYLQDPPVDAHTAVASAANIDRQSGKRLNQALITGAGQTKAATMLGLPMDEANAIVGRYFAAMPEIKTAQNNMTGVFRAKGYLTSLLGRRMRLDDPRFAYKAMNRILQGGNADIIKQSMARIDELLHLEDNGTRMLLNVHDDIVFQYPKDDDTKLTQSVGIMKDYGPEDQSVFLEVPMEVDVKTGRNWAEASWDIKVVEKAFKDMGAKYKP